MKNNFVPSFPFHKKEHQNINKNTPGFLVKSPTAPHDNIDKKINIHVDTSNQNDYPLLGKQIQTTEEESINSDQQSSCKSSQVTTKPSKIQHKLMRQQRIISPIKYEHISPFNAKPTVSPNIKDSRLGANHFMPIRATLKNLMQSKASPSNKNQQNFLSAGTHSNRDIHLNSSVRANKTLTEIYQSPLKSIQKQNQILREENEMLKRQLSQIKKNLIFGGGNKKEQIISNLRYTIKKQDSQNKQLRLKLDIFTKKNAALATLIQNKDQQISFLSNKILQMQQDLQQYKQQRQKNAQKFQKLKQRINYTIKSYNELQAKMNKSQIDWLNFQQKWMQQKGIYLHRISFLEQYISKN